MCSGSPSGLSAPSQPDTPGHREEQPASRAGQRQAEQGGPARSRRRWHLAVNGKGAPLPMRTGRGDLRDGIGAVRCLAERNETLGPFLTPASGLPSSQAAWSIVSRRRLRLPHSGQVPGADSPQRDQGFAAKKAPATSSPAIANAMIPRTSRPTVTEPSGSNGMDLMSGRSQNTRNQPMAAKIAATASVASRLWPRLWALRWLIASSISTSSSVAGMSLVSVTSPAPHNEETRTGQFGQRHDASSARIR